MALKIHLKAMILIEVISVVSNEMESTEAQERIAQLTKDLNHHTTSTM